MNTKKLLCSLVEIESISGNEMNIAVFLKDYFDEMGFAAKIDGRNLICELGRDNSRDGKTILLNSHLDTVPACPGWSFSPFKATKSKGRIYGLGSSDAKGCVASMVHAFASLEEKNLHGKVIIALTCDEETGGQGLEHVIKKLKNIDAAIVGEPTNLNVCIAQKGNMILKVKTRGRSAHSAYPEKGVNSIYKACDCIMAINEIKFKKNHEILGVPTIAVTMIKGGVKTNVIPAECEFTIDIRSTPEYSHEELFKIVRNKLKELKGADVKKHSVRLAPRETKKDEAIAAIAKDLLSSEFIGSSTMSDWAFLDCPSIKLGPGSSAMSHKANECIEIIQLDKAAEAYKNIVNKFLSIK